MELMGCIQLGKLTALIVVLKAIINGNKPTHISNGSDFDKTIQFRIGTWCVWPIEIQRNEAKMQHASFTSTSNKRMVQQSLGSK